MHLSPRKPEIFLLIAIALLSTAIVIFWSLEHGRLQYQMDYEDIITHIDGLKRLRDMSEGGGSVYLADYLRNPPHAPLHSMMASLGFVIFGVKDWAPYAVNALVLLALIMLVRRETRIFGSWPSWLAVVGALFVPVSFESIHEFRPDFPCAILTLWGMVLYPRWKEAAFGKKAAISGAIFGLALLAKPPFFPYTLAMGGLPWLMTAVEGAREKKSIRGILDSLWKSWPFFAGAVAVAGPHYLVAWHNILGYIQQNQFGADAHVWRMKGGLGYQLDYHVCGVGGNLMLGSDVFVLLGLAGAGITMSIFQWQRDNERSRDFLRILCFVSWAWLLIAINPHENPFFGLTFQYGLVLVAMFALAWLSSMAFSAKWPVKIAMALPISAVMGLVWMAFPLPQYTQNTGSSSATNMNSQEAKEFGKKLPLKAYEILKKWRPYSDSGYTLLSTYGVVSSHRLQWLAEKENQDFVFYGVPFWSFDKLTELFDPDSKVNHRVDFVMITEPGAEGVFESLPNAKTSGDLLDWIKKHDSYTCVDTIMTPGKKGYYLFMATPNFSIFDSSEGIGPKSKPLNVEGNPVIRQATSSKIDFNYNSPTSGVAQLELIFRGQPPVNHIEILSEGSSVGSMGMAPNNEFTQKNIPLKLKKGENRIQFLLVDKNTKPVDHPTLQFRRIRITPSGDKSSMVDIVNKLGRISR